LHAAIDTARYISQIKIMQIFFTREKIFLIHILQDSETSRLFSSLKPSQLEISPSKKDNIYACKRHNRQKFLFEYKVRKRHVKTES